LSEIAISKPAAKANVRANKIVGIILWAVLVAVTTLVFYLVGWTASGNNLIGIEMSLWAIVYAVMVVLNWGYPGKPNLRGRLAPTAIIVAIGVVLGIAFYFVQFPLYGEPTPALAFDNKSLMGINISLTVMITQFVFLWRGW
jgi:hypothetical protein